MPKVKTKHFVPRGNKDPIEDLRDYVKGFSSRIPYVVRNETGDWDTDYMTYQPQKFKFDTNSCWCISGNNIAEDQLDFLLRRGSFPEESIKWFRDNGYLNQDDCFQLSWRFIYALSGVYDNGNSQQEYWKILRKYGIPPQKDFDFSQQDSISFSSQEEMCRFVGDKSKISKENFDKAKKFLDYVSVDYEWVQKPYSELDLISIKGSLLQAPLQIGVPAELATWNNTFVPASQRKQADHAVELLKVNSDNSFEIYDQYRPQEKTLDKKYPIYLITLGLISPKIRYSDIPEVKLFEENRFTRVWKAAMDWIRYNLGY